MYFLIHSSSVINAGQKYKYLTGNNDRLKFCKSKKTHLRIQLLNILMILVSLSLRYFTVLHYIQRCVFWKESNDVNDNVFPVILYYDVSVLVMKLRFN